MVYLLRDVLLQERVTIVDKLKEYKPLPDNSPNTGEINSVINNEFSVSIGTKYRRFAIEDDKVIGAVAFDIAQRVCVIHHIGSLKRGIGSLLLKEVERVAEQKNCKRIQFWVYDNAKPFYIKHGYKHIDNGRMYKDL